MEGKDQGFLEVEHTADWELYVWGPTMGILFEQAAAGMYQLSGMVLETGPHIEREIKISAPDRETLLVGFLSELLFWGETENLGFDDLSLQVTGSMVYGVVRGRRIASQEKEIKAVTYHQMEIQKTSIGLEVNIVFDV